jgi:hypothetical protein
MPGTLVSVSTGSFLERKHTKHISASCLVSIHLNYWLLLSIHSTGTLCYHVYHFPPHACHQQTLVQMQKQRFFLTAGNGIAATRSSTIFCSSSLATRHWIELVGSSTISCSVLQGGGARLFQDLLLSCFCSGWVVLCCVLTVCSSLWSFPLRRSPSVVGTTNLMPET